MSHGNDVKLWFEEADPCGCVPSDKAETVVYVIEIRDVVCCLTKTSEWEEIRRVPPKGPGYFHYVHLVGLGRERSFQFRIFAEGVHRRSEALETRVYYTMDATGIPGHAIINDWSCFILRYIFTSHQQLGYYGNGT